MQRFKWKEINSQYLNICYTHHVKKDLSMHEFDFYSKEDDPNNLIIKLETDEVINIKLLAISCISNFIYIDAKNFTPNPKLFLALGLFLKSKEPVSLLIPSMLFKQFTESNLTNELFKRTFGNKSFENKYCLHLHSEDIDYLSRSLNFNKTLVDIRRRLLSEILHGGAYDYEFIHIVFRDKFIFSKFPQKYLDQQATMSLDQKKLALEIHASGFFLRDNTIICNLAKSLSDIFLFEGSDQKSIRFISAVFYFLKRYSVDADWFKSRWKLVDCINN